MPIYDHPDGFAMTSSRQALRGAMLSFRANPFLHDPAACRHYEADAIVWIEDGKIRAVGPASALLPTLPADLPVTRLHDSLILPGFIDSHVHYPQTQIIGAYGKQLLDWLNNYTFIAEQQFADAGHARRVADVFLQENLRNGITSASVYCTVHPQSVDALLTAAAAYDMRLIAGKVAMDRHAPAALLDSAQQAYDEGKALIERWHGLGRAEYAITPRFAPTSTPAQLDLCGALAREFPDTVIQSHIAENLAEIAWVRELFPAASSYADVYYRHGLLRERAVYGHGVHLSDDELELFSGCGAALAHCPTSNLFLGSGLFDLRRPLAARQPIRVGLATDIGGGTSFSMLQTLNEAYKVAQLSGCSLSASQAFYWASRGSAEALGIADKVGSIAAGMEADLVVLDLHSTPLIAFRMQYANDLDEALFIQMTLGDDRAIAATYIAGREVYRRDPA